MGELSSLLTRLCMRARCKPARSAAAFLCACFTLLVVLASNTNPVHAGIPTFACSAVPSGPTNNMAINVVAGERITVTLTAGSVQIRAAPPGMGLAPVGNPFVVDITGANAGTWSFAIDTGTATFTCSVIPPSNNSDTTAALQNSLDTTSQGILDNNGLPLGNGGGGGSNGATFAPTGLGFAVSRADDGNPLDRRFGAAFAP